MADKLDKIMQNKPIRLVFSENKEKIMGIMHHLNPKYLIGLWKKCSIIQYNAYWAWNDEERVRTYTKATVPVKYDGYIFYASVKTIKDEIKRRIELGEIAEIWVGVARGTKIRKHLFDIPNEKKYQKYEETNKKKRV